MNISKHKLSKLVNSVKDTFYLPV